jgi:2,4-dienoyl-CoA reductase-like NADH-dependent reductase (Old Yellow Enzyme family)
LEITKAVREVWPANRPLSVRLSASDWAVEGGWTIDDTIELVKELKKLAVDIIDVSSGGNLQWGVANNTMRSPFPEGYQVPFAAAIKKAVPEITIMAVGLITSGESSEHFLASGQADLIAVVSSLLSHMPAAVAPPPFAFYQQQQC